MTLSVGLFAILIYAALIVVAVSPVILLALLIRDFRNGDLW